MSDGITDSQPRSEWTRRVETLGEVKLLKDITVDFYDWRRDGITAAVGELNLKAAGDTEDGALTALGKEFLREREKLKGVIEMASKKLDKLKRYLPEKS